MSDALHRLELKDREVRQREADQESARQLQAAREALARTEQAVKEAGDSRASTYLVAGAGVGLAAVVGAGAWVARRSPPAGPVVVGLPGQPGLPWGQPPALQGPAPYPPALPPRQADRPAWAAPEPAPAPVRRPGAGAPRLTLAVAAGSREVGRHGLLDIRDDLFGLARAVYSAADGKYAGAGWLAAVVAARFPAGTAGPTAADARVEMPDGRIKAVTLPRSVARALREVARARAGAPRNGTGCPSG